MVQDPFMLCGVLALFACLVSFAFEHGYTRSYIRFLPKISWCYIGGMIMSYMGIIPAKSHLYTWCTGYLLPVVIILLLIQSDIMAIARLGLKSLMVMLSGSIGVMAGAIVACTMLREQLGPHAWKNLGAISASWTGGVANMFAIKQSLSIPDEAFAPIPIIDAIIAYSWLCLFICLASQQANYAKVFPVDERCIDDLRKKSTLAPKNNTEKVIKEHGYSVIIAIAIGGGCISMWLGHHGHWLLLDALKNLALSDVFTATSLVILVATALGVMLSLSPAKRYGQDASRIGTASMYILIQMYGAQVNIGDAGKAGWWLVAGFIIVIFMSAFMLLVNCWLKGPLVLLAVGGESNLAGPNASAILAVTYDPALASLGILLGLLGGIIGTACGLFVSQVCKLIST